MRDKVLVIKSNNKYVISFNGIKMTKDVNEFKGWSDNMIKSWACKQFNVSE